ncbi:hypothetical protein C8N32_10188 [Rhodovulum imhoffii]|uniref:Uncharacterized protein n=1 Tax=Rhodovulum imhoffii TaxID=365340 RepID=A0A2T5BW80_9RHOB|nr:hypothetical protein [Rhodovulum imhoffii]MBK5935139.1 hypothetical protein [Rhodovulum imhoffii]PTN03894.1 hypothetical protein C8N32_10188 [Rhodovulum imhoffii]
MSAGLPKYFFRVRENGAQVFRVNAENRHLRLDLEPLANVNIRNGEIKPQGGRKLTKADEAEIGKWMDARLTQIESRTLDDILRTIDHLNTIAHWAQSRATEAELEALTDTLLLAMHDLRTVLVRKRAAQAEKDADKG